MRFTSTTSTNGAEKAPNKFGSFDCPTNDGNRSASLAPSVDVLRDIHSMPKATKRRIILSDDEDERPSSTPKVSKSAGTPSSVEWIESRKVANLTQHERERNIQTAVEQRKQAGHPVKGVKPIVKASKVGYSEVDESDDILAHHTPIASAAALKRALNSQSSAGGFRSSLLNETFNDSREEALEAARALRDQAKLENRAQRVEQLNHSRHFSASLPQNAHSSGTSGSSKEPSIQDIIANGKSSLDVIDLDSGSEEEVVKPQRRKARQEVVEVEDSDNGASGSGEDDYHDGDLDRKELQALANKVLRQCESLSANLRRSLIQWETGADDADCFETLASPSHSGANALATRDCIDLTTIRRANVNASAKQSSSSSSAMDMQILYDEDISKLCPELSLKGYQLVGVNWLKLLHQNNVNGVLADDMGLGKTIQTIAFLGWLASLQPQSAGHSRKAPRPHLIVVPASTLSNWQNELQRFCPAFHVVTYHGSQLERSTLRHELRGGHNPPDVILSTYTIFEREASKSDRSFMYSLCFEYLVLDEAHCIKNAQSSRFVNLNMLKTKHRLLLSGTPVQNDISELLSMLSFLMPQVFGRDNRELLIEALNWSTTNVGGASTQKQQQGDLSLVQLRSMLAPFVLRRLKRDVLDQLTEKTVIVKRMSMTSFQKEVYDGILLGHAARKDLLKLKAQQDDDAARVLEGKMRSSAGAGGASSLNLPSLTLATGATATAGAGAAAVKADVCVSPFNRKKKSLAGDNSNVISLLSPNVDATKVVGKTSKQTAGKVSDGSESPSVLSSCISEVDASQSADPLRSVDIDVTSLAAVDETATAAVVQQMSASEANNLFTALRKAANHPLLLRVRYKDHKTLEKIAMIAYSAGHFGNQCDYQRVRDEIELLSDFDIHQLCLEYESLNSLQLEASALYDSPKMELLKALLPKLQTEGHRVLVFSQWTRLLDLLEVLLQDISMRYLRLDGSTPVKIRQDYIDTFNADTSIPVFLLSTKAGGLGINLTAADTVILHDLDFNPENDKQAEDRCHRIGQTRPVTIYKLFAEDTVDEDIYAMGERKSKLSKAVLQDDRQHQQQQQQQGSATKATKGGRGKSGDTTAESTTDAGAGTGAEDEQGSSAISSILQKALLKRVQMLATERK